MVEQTNRDVHEPARLSPEAMDLAHEIALFEGELRAIGRTARRIDSLRGRAFGPRITRLAMYDATAANIYRPDDDTSEADTPTAPVRSAADRRVMGWARAANKLDGDDGDARRRAFKD